MHLSWTKLVEALVLVVLPLPRLLPLTSVLGWGTARVLMWMLVLPLPLILLAWVLVSPPLRRVQTAVPILA